MDLSLDLSLGLVLGLSFGIGLGLGLSLGLGLDLDLGLGLCTGEGKQKKMSNQRDLLLFSGLEKRIEEKTGVLLQHLVNRYLSVMPDAISETKTWLKAIRDSDDEVALCYLNEMLLVTFAAGLRNELNPTAFSVKPSEVIDHAVNPKMTPIMK